MKSTRKQNNRFLGLFFLASSNLPFAYTIPVIIKPSSMSNDLTLKMASAQVIANNSPSQDSNHPDDHFQSRYVTPGFKPFSYL